MTRLYLALSTPLLLALAALAALHGSGWGAAGWVLVAVVNVVVVSCGVPVLREEGEDR